MCSSPSFIPTLISVWPSPLFLSFHAWLLHRFLVKRQGQKYSSVSLFCVSSFAAASFVISSFLFYLCCYLEDSIAIWNSLKRHFTKTSWNISNPRSHPDQEYRVWQSLLPFLSVLIANQSNFSFVSYLIKYLIQANLATEIKNKRKIRK